MCMAINPCSPTAAGSTMVGFGGGAVSVHNGQPKDDILAGVQRPAFRHLLLELFIGQRDAVTEIDEHVGDRSIARSLPVARIRHVLVRRRIVHVADDVQDGAAAAAAAPIRRCSCSRAPSCGRSRRSSASGCCSPRSLPGTSAGQARGGVARTTRSSCSPAAPCRRAAAGSGSCA